VQELFGIYVACRWRNSPVWICALRIGVVATVDAVDDALCGLLYSPLH